MRLNASIVASVPELAKRHSGSPKRRASSRPTGIRSSVGWAKCVPSATRSWTASTTAGWAWPDQHRAEAVVQVDVLGAVDVPDA